MYSIHGNMQGGTEGDDHDRIGEIPDAWVGSGSNRRPTEIRNALSVPLHTAYISIYISNLYKEAS